MTGPKTNERPGTRATLRGYHMSASKARVVLKLVRNEDVNTAREILAGTTREAADVIGKVLASAVANAVTNDGMNADELYISAAFADEGITMKRFTPRARGRAGKILKRSCHITVIVSRLDEDRLEVLRAQRNAQAAVSRTRRVASSRRRADQQASLNKRETAAEEAQVEAVNTDVVDTDVVETEMVENAVVEQQVITDEVDGEVVDTEVEETSAEETPLDETVSDTTTEETN
jgi:large subunit ribosomal protein L22